jgi:hypothetical protein
MAKYQPRVVRFSLDLDVEQKNFLRLYAAKNELSASIVLRAMIYILETDIEFSNRVMDLIFLAPEVEVENLDDEEELEDIDNTVENDE